MTKTLRNYPIFLFFYGLGMGISTNLSWVPLLGFLIGLAIMSIGWMIWIPLNRRKKMRTLVPQLELFLDEMIRLVEHPTRPLEKIILYNNSRQSGDKMLYNLQIHADKQVYSLATSTIKTGHHTGFMYMYATRHGGEGKSLRLDYPDISSFVQPEPWLIGRLDKLRSLVGDVSLYKARRERLSVAGIIIVTDDDTDPSLAA